MNPKITHSLLIFFLLTNTALPAFAMDDTPGSKKENHTSASPRPKRLKVKAPAKEEAGPAPSDAEQKALVDAKIVAAEQSFTEMSDILQPMMDSIQSGPGTESAYGKVSGPDILEIIQRHTARMNALIEHTNSPPSAGVTPHPGGTMPAAAAPPSWALSAEQRDELRQVTRQQKKNAKKRKKKHEVAASRSEEENALEINEGPAAAASAQADRKGKTPVLDTDPLPLAPVRKTADNSDSDDEESPTRASKRLDSTFLTDIAMTFRKQPTEDHVAESPLSYAEASAPRKLKQEVAIYIRQLQSGHGTFREQAVKNYARKLLRELLDRGILTPATLNQKGMKVCDLSSQEYHYTNTHPDHGGAKGVVTDKGARKSHARYLEKLLALLPNERPSAPAGPAPAEPDAASEQFDTYKEALQFCLNTLMETYLNAGETISILKDEAEEALDNPAEGADTAAIIATHEACVNEARAAAQEPYRILFKQLKTYEGARAFFNDYLLSILSEGDSLPNSEEMEQLILQLTGLTLMDVSETTSENTSDASDEPPAPGPVAQQDATPAEKEVHSPTYYAVNALMKSIRKDDVRKNLIELKEDRNQLNLPPKKNGRKSRAKPKPEVEAQKAALDKLIKSAEIDIALSDMIHTAIVRNYDAAEEFIIKQLSLFVELEQMKYSRKITKQKYPSEQPYENVEKNLTREVLAPLIETLLGLVPDEEDEKTQKKKKAKRKKKAKQKKIATEAISIQVTDSQLAPAVAEETHIRAMMAANRARKTASVQRMEEAKELIRKNLEIVRREKKTLAELNVSPREGEEETIATLEAAQAVLDEEEAAEIAKIIAKTSALSRKKTFIPCPQKDDIEDICYHELMNSRSGYGPGVHEWKITVNPTFPHPEGDSWDGCIRMPFAPDHPLVPEILRIARESVATSSDIDSDQDGVDILQCYYSFENDIAHSANSELKAAYEANSRGFAMFINTMVTLNPKTVHCDFKNDPSAGAVGFEYVEISPQEYEDSDEDSESSED